VGFAGYPSRKLRPPFRRESVWRYCELTSAACRCCASTVTAASSWSLMRASVFSAAFNVSINLTPNRGVRLNARRAELCLSPQQTPRRIAICLGKLLPMNTR
jgi:hypothetical protein